MKWLMIPLAAVVSMSMPSVGEAQCSRRSSNTAVVSRAVASTSLGSARSVATSYSPIAYQSRLARQRRLMMQQQLYARAVARQRNLTEFQQASAVLQQTAEQAESTTLSPRRQRMLEANVKRAYQRAIEAQSSRNYAAAEQQYRRVLRLAGKDNKLAKQAETALADLNQQNRRTPLVAALPARR